MRRKVEVKMQRRDVTCFPCAEMDEGWLAEMEAKKLAEDLLVYRVGEALVEAQLAETHKAVLMMSKALLLDVKNS